MSDNVGSNRQKEEQDYSKLDRLPPGQALTQKFPVLHYGPIPPFNPATWDFRIWGAVKEDKRWAWNEFIGLPRTEITIDLHCVTRWSKFDTLWEGISVRDLIESGIFEPDPDAAYVMQHAEYGYTANLPLEIILQENFLLATHFDGEPITPEHGYPVRGVIGAIPNREDIVTAYLWKGAKWLRGLEFMKKDRPGFWEKAGYNNNADVWKEERFA